jgi:hypothetical protein
MIRSQHKLSCSSSAAIQTNSSHHHHAFHNSNDGHHITTMAATVMAGNNGTNNAPIHSALQLLGSSSSLHNYSHHASVGSHFDLDDEEEEEDGLEEVEEEGDEVGETEDDLGDSDDDGEGEVVLSEALADDSEGNGTIQATVLQSYSNLQSMEIAGFIVGDDLEDDEGDDEEDAEDGFHDALMNPSSLTGTKGSSFSLSIPIPSITTKDSKPQSSSFFNFFSSGVTSTASSTSFLPLSVASTSFGSNTTNESSVMNDHDSDDDDSQEGEEQEGEMETIEVSKGGNHKLQGCSSYRENKQSGLGSNHTSNTPSRASSFDETRADLEVHFPSDEL